MKRSRKRWAFLALAVGLMMLFSACKPATAPADEETGPTETPEKPAEPTQVVIAQWTAPSGAFNYCLSESAYNSDISSVICESLIDWNENLECCVPAMAKDWDISDDYLTFTYYLRDDIKWHDGHPFTAEDVKFTFEFIMHPDYPGPSQSAFGKLLGAEQYLDTLGKLKSDLREEVEAEILAAMESEGKPEPGADATQEAKDAWQQEFEERFGKIHAERYDAAVRPALMKAYEEWKQKEAFEIVDEHTIKVHWDSLHGPALSDVGNYSIFAKHQWENVDVANSKMAEENTYILGTGPYKIVEFKKDQYTIVEKNPDYYRGEPKIDRIIYRVINTEAAVGMMRAGELDLIGVGSSGIEPADLPMFEEIPGVKVFENPDFGYQELYFNTLHEWFGDKRVRKAFAHAINRQGIVEELLEGHGSVMHTLFLPVSWAYDSSRVVEYDYSPEKAQEFLAEAGWTDTDGDGWVDKGGAPFKAVLLTPAGNKIREASGVLIQDNLKDVGVELTAEVMEFASLLPRILNTPDNAKPDFDCGLLGWSMDYEPDPYGQWVGTYDFTRWREGLESGERIYQLMVDGRAVVDQEERAKIYGELGYLMSEELPYVWLYTRNTITCVAPSVTNVNENILGALNNVHEWEVTK